MARPWQPMAHFAQGRRELGDAAGAVGAVGAVPNRCGTDPTEAAGGNGGASDLQATPSWSSSSNSSRT